MAGRVSQRRYRAVFLTVVSAATLLALVPFVWTIVSAFKSQQEIFGSPFLLPKEWHWNNFRTAWTEGHFATYTVNSILVAVAVVTIQIVVACPAGYAFAKSRLRHHPVAFYVYLFGLTLPAQSIFVPLFYNLRSLGLLNSRWGLILVIVATGVPFSVYLMRNFYRDLPDSLVEAARIDGAGEWMVFWRVMLPLSRPGVLALAVFSFLAAWNEFLFALLILIDRGNRTLPLGLVQFQNELSSDYGALFAGIVLAMIPSILVYVLLQRSFIRGLSAGSVK